MERPTGVTILAVLYFLGTALLGLFGLLFIVGDPCFQAWLTLEDPARRFF